VKWQDRGNQNKNPKKNVQKILAEKCNEGPRIEFFTHKAARTIVDMTIEGKQT